MRVLTIRLPDDQHERLRALAEHRGISLNKLFEEFATRAVAEFDTELRFSVRGARGETAKGLALLDKLDQQFGKQS
jgi:predicted transcriptional regulator